jgi:hypothetical protein
LVAVRVIGSFTLLLLYSGENKHAASLLPLLQAEYVRCSEEVDVLATVRDRRKAFAVALPGAEGRALQARGQDSKRSEQLQLRMVSLLQQLGKDEPLDPVGEEYRAGLAALRDQQLQGLQTQVEREVAALAVLQQRGTASTQAQKRRAAARRKKVRQLVAAMQTWQQSDLVSTATVQQLPAAWGDDLVIQPIAEVLLVRRLYALGLKACSMNAAKEDACPSTVQSPAGTNKCSHHWLTFIVCVCRCSAGGSEHRRAPATSWRAAASAYVLCAHGSCLRAGGC